ncbi:MAG: hypothetical protein DCF12_01365 [Snowella sp.]|jgi:hypothetical protein|nr:MAG: hypothetical protein DCF12_01365 [Snowella sp.]
METPLTVEKDIKDILNSIDQKLDGLNNIQVSVATLTTKIDQLQEDIREIKGLQYTQIWRLIWILVWTLVGIISTILLGAIAVFVLIALPNKS